MVTVEIDGHIITAEADMTILSAARAAAIHIPSLCYLENINEIAACRVCVVEIEGLDHLVPACATKIQEGMRVFTNTMRVQKARRINVELLLSQHDCQCALCLRNGNCELQNLAGDLGILTIPFPVEPRTGSWDSLAPFVKETEKCIQCMRCVQVCDKIQEMHIWQVFGSGGRSTIGIPTAVLSDTDCTYCGQCVTHCPTGALHERDDTAAVRRALADPETTTIIQVAPAVRVAWAEGMGLSETEMSTEKMVGILKAMGFDYVFDTNFAADLTILEEGSELLERLQDKESHQWPMFTSCCPAWVKFLKQQYPLFNDALSTVKSPQQMFGAVTKSYFSDTSGIDPHKMMVISIMPCIAKKEENKLENMRSACGDLDVDVILTTRELIRLMKAQHVNINQIDSQPFDSPLGSSTGAGVIFGASGGVMDAALRSAYYLIEGKNADADAFNVVRGIKGWKEATFTIPSFGQIRVAVVSGLGNAKALMEAVSKGEAAYDFVEVMACPGGCAGGGGQPIHEAMECAEARGEQLWLIDQRAAIRYSHENEAVLTLYRDFLGKPLGAKAHALLHTDENWHHKAAYKSQEMVKAIAINIAMSRK
ncbi:[FeFe] hydrogenase, group A [Fusibacter paucivorans]|uniref:[FeFe] hydrogenase, group A n=1 Tax=Fusibacter paucivorans TaxID=76009 RepID=A0ABS5PP88_9FIRM|nr:[FeFe] hydrogenase, group A [Fusibacter paucivorans]MBS7526988.1 [FeFe] hydrogenase, group A [Fusibacter paucivorans]